MSVFAKQSFNLLSSKVIAVPLSILFAGACLHCGGEDSKEKEEKKSSDGSTGGKEENTEEKTSDGDKTNSEEPAQPKEDGELCEKNEDCKSEKCREVSFVNPLNDTPESMKTCAACADDKECVDGQKGIACVPMAKLGTGTAVVAAYQCSDGDKGMSCESDAQCKDSLKCGAITLQGKASEVKTCGDCQADEDCKEEAKPLCSTVGVTQLKPHNTCVAAAGKKDGETCSGEGEAGDKECENYCQTLGGLLSFCVRCKEDSHCADGEKCTPAEVDAANPTNTKFPKCEPK